MNEETQPIRTRSVNFPPELLKAIEEYVDLDHRSAQGEIIALLEEAIAARQLLADA